MLAVSPLAISLSTDTNLDPFSLISSNLAVTASSFTVSSTFSTSTPLYSPNSKDGLTSTSTNITNPLSLLISSISIDGASIGSIFNSSIADGYTSGNSMSIASE
ncbi:hypothetical protein SDC9_142782 [bioreactor metagenome]|uniref:Uncharacterized protein n=1 Tax=bioreactor metagenome TaxID=1076179 RepID=A0A645E1S5_9ZZZZ